MLIGARLATARSERERRKASFLTEFIERVNIRPNMVHVVPIRWIVFGGPFLWSPRGHIQRNVHFVLILHTVEPRNVIYEVKQARVFAWVQRYAPQRMEDMLQVLCKVVHLPLLAKIAVDTRNLDHPLIVEGGHTVRIEPVGE